MPISTSALTVHRIFATRSADACEAFVSRFSDLGFNCHTEMHCGFWLVHYQYFGIQRPDF